MPSDAVAFDFGFKSWKAIIMLTGGDGFDFDCEPYSTTLIPIFYFFNKPALIKIFDYLLVSHA